MFKTETYEKAVLLCQARGMFPDLVRFRWQAEDHNKQNVQLGSEERLEQRDEDPEVRITSMLIIDKQKAESKTFTCLVQHDSSVKDQKLSIPTDEDIRKAQKESMPDSSKAICPTQKPKEDKEEEEIRNFDTPVKEPQVSAFTMFKTETYEKAVLLCQARGMFPDLVRFRWQAEDHNKQNVQLGSEERLEQRDEDPEVRITSMLIIDKQKAESKTFTCSVQHDSSVTDQKLSIPTDEDIRKAQKESMPDTSKAICPTQKPKEEEEEEIMNFDTPVKEPQVSAFTMFKTETYEKAVLLCQARGMFPDLVRFRWQAEDHNKQNVQLGSEERLEQRDEDPEVRITSMLIIDKQKAESKTFTCSVQHDSSVTDQKLSIPTDEDIRKAQKESMPDTSKAICPTQKPKEEEEEEIMNFGVLALSRSLYLFSVTYVILLVKNVLYFCTVSVLLCMRNPANMEMSRSKVY
ncbi:hypothetical protein QTP86_004576 [Hemibagrus guttatus]|nr:hypothetical protein QTP86_004576 [Hemibagrus guttatus]